MGAYAKSGASKPSQPPHQLRPSARGCGLRDGNDRRARRGRLARACSLQTRTLLEAQVVITRLAAARWNGPTHGRELLARAAAELLLFDVFQELLPLARFVAAGQWEDRYQNASLECMRENMTYAL